MGNEHQTRRDIDRLYDDLYSQGELNAVLFDVESELERVYYKDDQSDIGTIDAILKSYRLLEMDERVSKLENKIEELENRLAQLEQ